MQRVALSKLEPWILQDKGSHCYILPLLGLLGDPICEMIFEAVIYTENAKLNPSVTVSVARSLAAWLLALRSTNRRPRVAMLSRD